MKRKYRPVKINTHTSTYLIQNVHWANVRLPYLLTVVPSLNLVFSLRLFLLPDQVSHSRGLESEICCVKSLLGLRSDSLL